MLSRVRALQSANAGIRQKANTTDKLREMHQEDRYVPVIAQECLPKVELTKPGDSAQNAGPAAYFAKN
jgi:hypothetical protein